MKEYLLKIYYFYLDIIEKFHVFYNKNFLMKKFKVQVKTTDETIEKLLTTEVSMSRFGDGEFALMSGGSLKFQNYDKLLAKRLKEIINSNLSNHIVCIPNVFSNLDIYIERARRYWEKYLYKNLHKLLFLNKDKKYFDSLVSRTYLDVEDKSLVKERFEKLKKIWRNKNIIIVEGEKSRLGIGNDLFGECTSIRRIICPSESAFSKYEIIFNEVKKYSKNNLILIALGPTATVLAYDLAKEGYRALDIGHIDIEYEWFLGNVQDKQPVKNKYIGEVGGGDIVDDINNQEYESQIIVKLCD